jgi:hypothetical protein
VLNIDVKAGINTGIAIHRGREFALFVALDSVRKRIYSQHTGGDKATVR